MDEIESKSKPRRAQGGKGLLSHQISVQKCQQSIPLVLILERERRRTGRERHTGERWEALASGSGFFQAQGREERGEGVFKVSTQGSKIPLDKLETKTPVGAKPEIFT